MMKDWGHLEQQLLNQCLEDIQALPNVEVELIRTDPSENIDSGFDALAELRVNRRTTTVLIELKSSVYPRDAREMLWRIRNPVKDAKNTRNMKRVMNCLVANAISPGAKELLQNERIAYYDSGGSLFLPANGLYVYVDKPPPKPMTKAMRSVFEGRRAQVVHAILVHDDDWFKQKEIALAAQASPALTSQVINQLVKFEWLVSRGRGPRKERCLSEPGALLDAWKDQLISERPLTMRRYFVPMSGTGTDSLVRTFSRVCEAYEARYALTHEAAAQHYAPFLSKIPQVRCRMVVDEAAQRALEKLDARSVDHGANLVVIDVDSVRELLFREVIGESWIASPIQVYLDLMRGEGRAKEMAEHLRTERIGF